MKSHITGKDLQKADSKVTLSLGGKEYTLAFNFNVICELEEHYGSFDKAGEALDGGKMKDVRFLLFAILKQKNKLLTEHEVGELIDLQSMGEVMEKLGEAMAASAPKEQAEKKEQSPQEK